MSLILNEKYIGINKSYKLFITNRLIRLYPIYWAVLILTILACVGVIIMTNGQSLPKFDSYLKVTPNIFSFLYLIITNLIIFGQDIVMFLGIRPESGNLYFTSDFGNTSLPLHSFLFIPQAWTLGLELLFYLFAPFILRRGTKVITLLIVLSLSLRLFLYNYWGLQKDPWTYRFFPTEIMFFLFGYFSYRLYLKIKIRSIPKYLSLAALSLIFIFTFLYPWIPSTMFDWFPFSLKEILYFSLIVISIPLLFNSFKKSGIDNHIGELSYPVYISHMLVIMIFTGLSIEISRFGWLIVLATIILSYVLNKVISLPIEKYRQSRLKTTSK